MFKFLLCVIKRPDISMDDNFNSLSHQSHQKHMVYSEALLLKHDETEARYTGTLRYLLVLTNTRCISAKITALLQKRRMTVIYSSQSKWTTAVLMLHAQRDTCIFMFYI